MRRRGKRQVTHREHLHGDFYMEADDKGIMTISMNPESTSESDFTPKLEALIEELKSVGIGRSLNEHPATISIFHVQNGKMAPIDPMTLALAERNRVEGDIVIDVVIYHKTFCRYLSSGADTPCRCDPGVRAKPPRRDE